MPRIVVGADTQLGEEVLRRLAADGGETRAFVTDIAMAATFRSLGAKVAIGDLSDGSHIQAAALGAFTAVLMAEAAFDGRELSFAAPADLLDVWTEALKEAGIRRLIVVGGGGAEPLAAIDEAARVRSKDRDPKEIADEVAVLDGAARL
jgi:putative NADH-flavin reductase